MHVRVLNNAGLDYIVIGCIGFYQVGSGTPRHAHVEKKVLLSIFSEEPWLSHDRFQEISKLQMVEFPHDFGEYSELCVTIKKDVLFNFSEQETDDFYAWVNKLQQYLSSSEDKLMALCRELHGGKLDVAYHNPRSLLEQYRKLRIA